MERPSEPRNRNEATPRHAEVHEEHPSAARPLAWFVVGYSMMHHNGLMGTSAAWTGTRLTDWVDVATPFAVLLPLLWFLWLQQPGPRAWLTAAIGSILYVEGHGIHLSSNSIGNVATPDGASQNSLDIIHLWDEVVGHYVWYLGLAVVVAACALSVRGRSVGVPQVALVVGGALVGITWATNALEGGTALASLAVSILALVPALRRKQGLASALAACGSSSVLILTSYAAMHGGFPQPSSL